MTQREQEEMNRWMAEPGNMEKLSLLEMAEVNLAYQHFMEAIGPVIKVAVLREALTAYLSDQWDKEGSSYDNDNAGKPET